MTKTLVDHLATYAAYHRDRRNIVTHFIGIPLIVVAVSVLLSRPAMDVAGVPLSPALVAGVLCMIFYLRLDARFGAVMAALFSVSLWIGHAVAARPTPVWLAVGLGGFFIGWVFQFVGHYYEGRKPAFVDDLVGLVVGPLFVVAEAAFLLGWRKPVQQAIEARTAGA